MKQHEIKSENCKYNIYIYIIYGYTHTWHTNIDVAL